MQVLGQCFALPIWNKKIIDLCFLPGPEAKAGYAYWVNDWQELREKIMHQERKSPKVSWARMYQIIASILFYLIITLQCRNRHYYSTLSRIFLENSFDSNCWKMMNLDLEFGWNKDPFLSIKVLVNQFY